MPIDTFEKFDSRYTSAGVDPAQERHYAVLGTDDELTARLAVQGGSPVVIDLYLDGTVYVWRQSIDMEPVGEEHWHGVVRYSTVRPTNESTFSFDTGGGTAHITQSLATTATYPNPTQWLVAPDFKGAIGATADGVEGTDVVVPVYQFSETHYLPATFVTPAYKATVFWLTGKVSSQSFKGFNAGEVLFLGAAGSMRGGGDWEITYRFAASANVTGLTVGPITGINKKGWEYLWVRYIDAEDSAAKALVKIPAAAYVEQVYPTADLNDLGI
jgi:hypothetical protein